ncbi:hypothetical protein Ddye_013004 [Dipteronia dyeriana]|uniref:Protein kinase domain-containing protein n=1 Tax=Dipteronia dyeriana TaxID=168575 RepID=A0AAD9X5C9_9ROSI|nr:hypothetical protein Ddye_013004 [Dipteronia dyeriana]
MLTEPTSKELFEDLLKSVDQSKHWKIKSAYRDIGLTYRDDETIAYIASSMCSSVKCQKKDFKKLISRSKQIAIQHRFPKLSPGAVDLLEKMLVFNPNKRNTVDEALCHPYLAPLHDINEKPICPRPFSFDFEHPSFIEENIKELKYRETVNFNSDPTH